MSVKLTGQVEQERIQNAAEARKKPTWEHLRTLSIVEAVRFARDNGWAENKVQVRAERNFNDAMEFIVEPWEKDCSCPQILKYRDYYGSEDQDDILR